MIGFAGQHAGTSLLVPVPDASIKQEPVSPNFSASTNPSSPQGNQRYTPSPNTILPSSLSPNIAMTIHQQQYDMMSSIPSVSPLQNSNIVNQQYTLPQSNNFNQFNIPNDFINNNNLNHGNQMEQNNTIEQILVSNNLGNINQINQLDNNNITNTNNNALDSDININNLLDMDSQQQINSNDLSGILRYLDNNNGTNAPQQTAAHPNVFDEDNMSDSFNHITIDDD